MPSAGAADQYGRLKALKPFVHKFTKAVPRKDHAYTHCLRASFAKSFEFCIEAHKRRVKGNTFFLIPSLRSICEDLIVLSYVGKLSAKDRNSLIALLVQQEATSRVEIQAKFFSIARPDQPVVGPGTTDRAKLEDAIREIWRRNGWPGLIKSWMPAVRQIAEKTHIDVLVVLYDYIYRMTSGTVHFNASALIRTGWGKPVTRFSTRNFDAYYVAYARIYGLLLFCCYFELFAKFLRPSERVSRLVTELRWNLISEFRWPEMVTHEEMNFSPPKADPIPRLVYRYVDAHRRKRRLLTMPNDNSQTLKHVKRLLKGLRNRETSKLPLGSE
jgi:hypothetical protein